MYGMLRDALWWIRENLSTIGAILGGVVAVVFIIGLIALGMIEHQKWIAWCEGQGGHVISDTDTHVGTGIGTNGEVVTTTTSETDHYCLNEAGGIIDIR